MRPRVITVTNCFPPKVGGIQTFVHELALRLPYDSLVVVAPDYPGARVFDAEQRFPVVRWPHELDGASLLRPGFACRVIDIAKRHGCTRAWISELVPLGLLSRRLKSAKLDRVVALSHGAELLWAQLPVARALLARAAMNMDTATYLSDYARRHLEPVIGKHVSLVQLAPGVDVQRFNPRVSGLPVRRRLGLGDQPVIVCVSRLVPRKGQDALIRALPRVARKVPNVHLLIVGGGPYEGRLRSLRNSSPLSQRIILASEVAFDDLASYYRAGDVFAMPCRNRFGTLEAEGLGMVYLEASACGLPVVAGNSGGAPDAVLEGETGYVIDGRDGDALVDRLVRLLTDRTRAHRMGEAGRKWMESAWHWDRIAAQMRALLWPEE